MRATLTTSALLCSVAVSACVVGDGTQADPPLLKISSPARSAIHDQAGEILVTGNIAPNPTGAAIATVKVNGIAATVGPDGEFRATIRVAPGATLIHTVATDSAGGLATDTRSVLAGERRMSGSMVPNAVGAAISAPAFARFGQLATAAIKSANLTALIAPLNPVVRSGDENGPDCLYARGFVDTVTITDASISLVPVAGGLQISATLTAPRITGRTQHAVACVNGMSTFVITANSVTVGGILTLTPNGMNGLTTTLADPVIALPGLNITATNFPDGLLNVLPLERIIKVLAPTAVKLFVDPMINDAVGALSAPQQVAVLGKTVTLQVSPRAASFDAAGGLVMLDMRMAFDGAGASAGYTFTPNGEVSMQLVDGIGVGIADDLANDVLAQLTASGMLNLNLRSEGSDFTTAKITATSPPTISADATDGKLRVIIPDMMVTFLDAAGNPVSRAAVNAQVPIAVVPADGGASVAIELGAPAIAIDTLDDLTGLTMPPESDFARTITLSTTEQAGSIGDMLGKIPLPKVGSLQLSNLSVGGGNGYVLVKTSLN